METGMVVGSTRPVAVTWQQMVASVAQRVSCLCSMCPLSQSPVIEHTSWCEIRQVVYEQARCGELC